MAKFPEVGTIGMISPIKQEIRFKTLSAQFGTQGNPQRKQKWLYPRRDLTVEYNFITKSQANTLWAFYIARKGSYELFNFFLPEPEQDYFDYTSEYIGTSDGVEDTYNLPCKTSSGRSIYSNTSLLTENVDYNFTAEGGVDGADQIDFTDSAMSPPASGQILTISFTGILKVCCRFKEDNFDFDTFYDRLVSTGIKLEGFLNE